MHHLWAQSKWIAVPRHLPDVTRLFFVVSCCENFVTNLKRLLAVLFLRFTETQIVSSAISFANTTELWWRFEEFHEVESTWTRFTAPPSPTLTVFKQLTWGILIRVSIWAFEFPTFVCRVFKNKSVRIKIFWKARVYLWLGCVDVANEWLECGLNRIHHTSPKVFTCHYMRSPRISCCDTIRITATEIGWRSYIIV